MKQTPTHLTVVAGCIDGKVKLGHRLFDLSDAAQAADHLRRYHRGAKLLRSSSCDHPEEYGVSPSDLELFLALVELAPAL